MPTNGMFLDSPARRSFQRYNPAADIVFRPGLARLWYGDKICSPRHPNLLFYSTSALLYSHDGGDHEGHHLSRGHDDREDDGAELFDGVEDEELAGGGGDGQRHHVEQGLGVHGEEPEAQHELAALRAEGEDR